MATILIIEDDAEIRINLQEILELAEFTILTAENGSQGLQIAKMKTPDLILCDIGLPDIDGYEVLQQLRHEPQLANIPFIFLTAMAAKENLRQGMVLGADDYLTKPAQPLEIIAAVKARLERQALAKQQYLKELQKLEKLQHEFKKHQNKLQDSQQLAQIRGNVLQQVIEDLRNPVSNINMAITMLKNATTDEVRNQYLSILQEECAREIQMLNQIDSLQKLLTDENTKLLQHYRLLENSENPKK